MSKSLIILLLSSITTIILQSCQGEAAKEKDQNIVLLDDNAGWCWFQDERAIIDGNQLLFTNVTSKGVNTVTRYDLATGERQTVVMNDSTFQTDDHNVGALMVRPDGRYLTVYAGHGDEPKMRYRISTQAGDISEWETEKSANTGGNTTYSNIYRLSSTGKTYNFHRGIGTNPNYMVSDDDGESWKYGGQVFAFPGRPYVRYASNDTDRIDFITTEEHPRYYNNSIYHGYIENGQIYRSDGSKVGNLSQSEQTDIKPFDFTTIYNGDSTTRTNVAWTQDIELDENGYPYVAFSVVKDPIRLGETKDTQEGGFDNRYHYARWDGRQWHEYEIAYAGTRLYPGENEYTGLIALHPKNPNVVYISADVNPATGKPLTKADTAHYEIFRGTTTDQGANWEWTPITQNSQEDNIRPIVVANEQWEVVLWLKGHLTTFRNYNLKAYGLINKLPVN
uniref:BNR-4 repeat-containing protein n=1 Tax=Roseihalotalea indica TaxID=2867963 RepID=A0AA49GRC1_9BACT|nr:BNR-4 repeat-containing protein [Tunicatimonas sp. TK19036]